MKNRLLLISVCILATMQPVSQIYGQNAPEATPDAGQKQPGETVRFTFRTGNDTLYVKGNEAELARLYRLADEYRADITSGETPLYVDGYCASAASGRENLHMAYLRANRVKSELIVKKGLKEEHFVTANHAVAYEGMRDVVVVTLRLPAKPEKPGPEPGPVAEERPRQEPAKEELTKESAPERAAEPSPATGTISGTTPPENLKGFYLRTNLLYDVLLLPTLGVEWRPDAGFGVKVDGSFSHWGSETGNVQKIWMVSPEVRRYLGNGRRFYLGLGANIGEYNVYGFPVGKIVSGNTGYQGKLYGGGITGGYRLRLSRCFSLDFHLGLGYTRFEYDTFEMANRVRVYKKKDETTNFWGPAQAGVTLTWKMK